MPNELDATEVVATLTKLRKVLAQAKVEGSDLESFELSISLVGSENELVSFIPLALVESDIYFQDVCKKAEDNVKFFA